MDIQKSNLKAEELPFGTPDETAMEKISQYTKKRLDPKELFAFTVTLCDNDIDRDCERFSETCLTLLAPLMKGRTGICDHDNRAQNQSARLYDCYTAVSDTEKNRLGQPLMRLVGEAYMLRTPGQAETIAQIEGGIRREVSISCSVKKQTCSVCGKDIRSCGHLRGRDYDGKLCFAELSEPADGYEWSFVAVPAQKNAGVTKSKKAVRSMETTQMSALSKAIGEGTLTEREEDVILTGEEAVALSKQIASLGELAETGRLYLKKLREETLSASVLAGLNIPESVFEKLSAQELTALKKDFDALAAGFVPVTPQTAPEASDESSSELDGYII